MKSIIKFINNILQKQIPKNNHHSKKSATSFLLNVYFHKKNINFIS